MKKYFLVLSILIGSLSTQAQPAETGTQDRPITRDIKLGNVSTLLLNGTCSVHLTQSNSASVRVEADSALQDKVLIETKGDTLLLSTNKSRKDRKKKINVYISFVELTEINSRINGELITTAPIKQRNLRYKSTALGNSNLQLEVDSLWLNISANGETRLSGRAIHCELKNNSVGHVKAGDLMVENMQISAASTGGLEYYATNVVIVKNVSLGNLVNKKKKAAAQ
jgi:hypothetical protein